MNIAQSLPSKSLQFRGEDRQVEKAPSVQHVDSFNLLYKQMLYWLYPHVDIVFTKKKQQKITVK